MGEWTFWRTRVPSRRAHRRMCVMRGLAVSLARRPHFLVSLVRVSVKSAGSFAVAHMFAGRSTRSESSTPRINHERRFARAALTLARLCDARPSGSRHHTRAGGSPVSVRCALPSSYRPSYLFSPLLFSPRGEAYVAPSAPSLHAVSARRPRRLSVPSLRAVCPRRPRRLRAPSAPYPRAVRAVSPH